MTPQSCACGMTYPDHLPVCPGCGRAYQPPAPPPPPAVAPLPAVPDKPHPGGDTFESRLAWYESRGGSRALGAKYTRELLGLPPKKEGS